MMFLSNSKKLRYLYLLLIYIKNHYCLIHCFQCIKSLNKQHFKIGIKTWFFKIKDLCNYIFHTRTRGYY